METLAYQDLIVALAEANRDHTPGITSANAAITNQMIDASRGGTARDRLWEGSEIIFLEPSARNAGRTGLNPFIVTGFTNTGIFTFNTSWSNSTGVPANLPYAIIRNRGQGAPYRSYAEALRYALSKNGDVQEVLNTSLLTSAGNYTYTIPAGIDAIYEVTFTGPTGRLSVRPGWWTVLPGRRLFLNNPRLPVAGAYTIEIMGLQRVTLPTELDATLRIALDEIIDLGLEYLSRGGVRPGDTKRGDNLMQERLRTNYFPYYSNLVEVL